MTLTSKINISNTSDLFHITRWLLSDDIQVHSGLYKYIKSRHLLFCRLRTHLYVAHWFCTHDEVCTSVCFHSTQRCSTCRCADPFVYLSCKGLRMLEHPSKDTDTSGYYHCLASYLFFLFIKSIAKKAPICYQKPTWTRQS